MATEPRAVETDQPFRVPKAAELVARHLRNKIVRGELQEGDTLPREAELIEEFGVSRPTLREALRVLESESLIIIRRGARGGARVKGVSSESAARYAGMLLQARGTTIADLYRARIVLEPPAARMLADQGSKKTIKALRKELEEDALAADSAEDYVLRAARFHEQVMALAGNQTLAVLGEMLNEIIELHAAATPEQVTISPQVTHLSLRDHEHLVELIEEGDGAGAEAFWRKHLEDGMDAMLKGLGSKKVLDLLE